MLKEFLTEADLDGDGNVNYEEFITLIFKVFLQGIWNKMSEKMYFPEIPVSGSRTRKEKQWLDWRRGKQANKRLTNKIKLYYKSPSKF